MGPIPLGGLSVAAGLPGKALHVALALWYQAGLTKARTVKASRGLLKRFGVERKAGYSSLGRLEEAGLISVTRHVGRCPRVTILDNRGEAIRKDGSSKEAVHGEYAA